MDIKGNYESVKEKIAISAQKSGRNPEDIKIVAVCKKVGVEEVKQAMEAGMGDFAENHVQNLLEKQSSLSDKKINWHLIGHLQTNKVKYIIDRVSLIHSVDSIKLAGELERQARKINKSVDCLLQLNVSGEEQKFGLNPDEAYIFLEKVSQMEFVRIKGLMAMTPLAATESEKRKIFSKTRTLYIDFSNYGMHNISMDWLSMGMSDDFAYAVEEGSNMVRIGTDIFH